MTNRMGARSSFLLVMAFFVLLFVGCSGTGGSPQESGTGNAPQANQPEVKAPDPVTLSMLVPDIPGDELNDLNKTIQKKYPYISMKIVKGNVGLLVNTLLVNNDAPDIVIASPGGWVQLREANALLDLAPRIKSNKFDLSRYNQEVWQGAEKYFEKGQDNFLPIILQAAFLAYNKDLFDKFGVPYPKDGMTWDEAIELARKMTRTDGGTSYQGIGVRLPNVVGNNQLSLPFGDVKTSKPVLETDGWKTWFNTMRKMYEIPGSEPTKKADFTPDSFFYENKTMAMMASPGDWIPNYINAKMNWDMVTLPSFKEAPNRNLQPTINFVGISTTSKHPDDAYKVVSVMLSDEWQLYKAKKGVMSPLKDPAINSHLFEESPEMKGKNIAALTKNKYADWVTPSKYKSNISSITQQSFIDMVLNKKDVNTALREAQEQAEQKVAELEAGGK